MVDVLKGLHEADCDANKGCVWKRGVCKDLQRQYILGGAQCGTEWYKFYSLKTRNWTFSVNQFRTCVLPWHVLPWDKLSNRCSLHCKLRSMSQSHGNSLLVDFTAFKVLLHTLFLLCKCDRWSTTAITLSLRYQLTGKYDQLTLIKNKSNLMI